MRNLQADPAVAIVAGGIRVEGRARVIAPDEPDDQRAREAIAAKYGTTGLKTWLRTSLPVAIDLEEVGARADGSG